MVVKGTQRRLRSASALASVMHPCSEALTLVAPLIARYRFLSCVTAVRAIIVAANSWLSYSSSMMNSWSPSSHRSCFLDSLTRVCCSSSNL